MAKIIGIGDNVVDINLTNSRVYPGGQALNVAANASMLGAECAYIGSIGNGEAGEIVCDALDRLGVDRSRCRRYPVPNFPSYYRIIDDDRVFVAPPVPLHPMTGVLFEMLAYEGFTQEDYDYIRTFDVAHLSNDSRIEAYLPEFVRQGIDISFDFSVYHDRPGYMEKVCPYVKFAFYSVSHLDRTGAEELLRRSCALGTAISVGTMGAEGALCYDGRSFYEQPACRLEKVVDTMGAGDAFTAAALVRYYDLMRQEPPSREEPIREMLAFASRYAADVCIREGAIGLGRPYNGSI